MAEAAAIAAVAGVGINILGQNAQAKAQERAALAQAEAKRLQAFEVLRRSEFNIDELEAEAKRFRGQQTAAFAKSGVDVGSGASLVQLEQLNRDLVEQVAVQREEADFKAKQLFAGADIDTKLSGDIRTAATFNMIGSGLQGVSLLGS